MRYAVVIEKADGNYSAYVPDLPGCVATGLTVEAVEVEIRDAIRFHIEGLRADGLPVSAATTIADYAEGVAHPRLSDLSRQSMLDFIHERPAPHPPDAAP